jgi:hypothetical protein
MRALGVLLACAGVMGYALWLASGVLVKEGNWVAVDFHVYYTAAHVLAQGHDIYTAGISPLYVYPPLLAILSLPLAALPVNAATITWKLLQHLFLLSAGAMLVSMVPRGARLLAAGALLFGWLLVPVQDEILLGESNALVLLLVVGAIWVTARAVEQEKRGAGVSLPGLGVPPKSSPITSVGGGPSGDTLMAVAGMLLALAAAIKVLPLLLVAYFWWRGPRRVAAFATIGFVALQLASLAVTPSTARYWFVEFPSLFGQSFPFLDNQSFNAAISRAVQPTDPSLPNMQLLQGDLVRSLLTWAANLLALAALFLVLKSSPSPGAAGDKETYQVRLLLETGLVLLTIHLVSGSAWMHHLVDLCVPVCGLLGAWWLRSSSGSRAFGSRATTATFAALGVVFVLLFRRPADWLTLFGGLAASSPVAALAISNSGLWAVVVLWVAVAAALTKDEGVKRKT